MQSNILDHLYVLRAGRPEDIDNEMIYLIGFRLLLIVVTWEVMLASGRVFARQLAFYKASTNENYIPLSLLCAAIRSVSLYVKWYAPHYLLLRNQHVMHVDTIVRVTLRLWHISATVYLDGLSS